MTFKPFPEIKRIGKLWITVTQKIHGTNASVGIEPSIEVSSSNELDTMARSGFEVRAAKRGGFITPEDDNFGFAKFVEENRQEFIDKLGPGVWHGEWAGPGINSGEGLKEKTFCLFDVKALEGRPLPPRCVLVPLLYEGPLDTVKVELAKLDLKVNGSKLVPGFMRPEGVVVHFLGSSFRYKDVFEPEETAWGNVKKERVPREPGPDLSHLLQPMRLEKLMSRDESLKRGWPENFSKIMKLYVTDLEKEGQLDPDPDKAKAQKKGLGKQLAHFLKEQLGT